VKSGANVPAASGVAFIVVSLSLFVLRDDIRRPNAGLIGIPAEFSERPALTQEIPTLVELDLDCLEPLMV
jgi:hypothetical protein